MKIVFLLSLIVSSYAHGLTFTRSLEAQSLLDIHRIDFEVEDYELTYEELTFYELMHSDHKQKLDIPREFLPGMPDYNGRMRNVPTSQIGDVIRVGRELIALGEQVYQLVLKGKPTVDTSYAPISVIPRREDGNPTNILYTENWQLPKAKKIHAKFKNGFGSEVIKFTYMVIFSYGGSFEGKGSYLTAAQVIPSRVEVSYGHDFSSVMKLGGITNHGTAQDPVAGAMLIIEYKVRSMFKVIETSDTYHITGKGDFYDYNGESILIYK